MYLAYHVELEEYRAVKVVPKSIADYDTFRKEALFLKTLRHPGIPIVYDVEEDTGYSYLIEEYLEGESLYALVKRMGSLSVKAAVDLGIQICRIIQFMNSAENPILYLDLQPKNLLVCNGDLRLTDFDHAQYASDAAAFGERYGTIGFAAPEQYHRLYQDCRADIYSLGMLILYMDNGHVQCHAESLHHKKFYPIVKKCIHHSIWQRYRSVKQVRQAVYSLQAENELPENIKAQNISLYGTKHGVGTTHIALCLTAYLTRNGFRAVYVQEADEEDFICEIRESILQTDGTFRCGTIAVCPQYHGAVQADLYGYDYIVRDCGTIAGLSAQADIKIVVTDFGYRRRLEYERLLQSDKDSLIFVNHTDGNVFYKETGRLEIKRQFYRIPCVYDWNNGSKLLDRVFLEALSAVISKPCRKQVKGGAGAGRKYIISKNK